MMDPRDYSNETIYTVTNYIYWFILLTFYFSVTNFLFLILFLFFEWDFSNIILYLLSLVPTGPALSALFYCFKKMVKEKELAPTKDFFQGYRKNFTDALKLWIPSLIIMYILAVDLKYYLVRDTTFAKMMTFVFLLLIVLFLLIMLYAVQINTFFVFRIRDIFRLSAYYILMNLKETLGNFGIVIVSLIVANFTSNYILLFCVCVIFYLIFLNSRNVMEDIRINFVKTAVEQKAGK